MKTPGQIYYETNASPMHNRWENIGPEAQMRYEIEAAQMSKPLGDSSKRASEISAREHFAALAMQGMLSHHGRYWQSNVAAYDHLTGLDPQSCGQLAVQFADALVAALNAGEAREAVKAAQESGAPSRMRRR